MAGFAWRGSHGGVRMAGFAWRGSRGGVRIPLGKYINIHRTKADIKNFLTQGNCPI